MEYVGIIEAVDSGGQVRMAYPGISGPVCGPEPLLRDLIARYRERGRYGVAVRGERIASAPGPQYCEWYADAWRPASEDELATGETATVGELLAAAGSDPDPGAAPSEPLPGTYPTEDPDDRPGTVAGFDTGAALAVGAVALLALMGGD